VDRDMLLCILPIFMKRARNGQPITSYIL